MQVKSIRERDEANDKISDMRIERLEALVDKALTEIKIGNAQLISELRHETKETKSELKVMNARIDQNLAEYKAIAESINGEVKALKTGFDTLQNKFSWNLAWVGIIMGLVLAIVQHFWK
ncbi:MAG: hypothetical protein IJ667_07675 [Synergistaceae bacterium]|nr:hypothetical protein [Synergistaceae bacterium]